MHTMLINGHRVAIDIDITGYVVGYVDGTMVAYAPDAVMAMTIIAEHIGACDHVCTNACG